MTPEQRQVYDAYLQKALIEYEWSHPYQTGDRIADAALTLGVVGVGVSTVNTAK